jgi:LacI family transcriptional regulator
MPTMSDVAKKAGVSVMTVSRIISGTGSVKDSTRKRVLRAMEELNYVPKGLTKRVIQQQISTLMLIVPDITNSFFTFVARGMEDVARKHGYRVFLANTDESVHKEAEYIQMCLDFHADGVLIAPVGESSRDNLQLLQQNEIPFVLIDREVTDVRADVVKGDIVSASKSLVLHLLEKGHRRIGIVLGPEENSASRERLQGYQQALMSHGIEMDQALVQESTMMRDLDPKFVDRLLQLPAPPTAIFVSNMFQYAHAVKRLKELKLNVPEDISIVGFGNTDYLAAVDSPLTSAVQPAYSYGSLGTQLLVERIEGLREPPRKIHLQADIVYGESVSARHESSRH